MTFDDFTHELRWLAGHFEKSVSDALAHSLYDELQSHLKADWARAVRALARKPDQRAWPRVGQLLEAVEKAALDRHAVEWIKEKSHEAAEVKVLMSGQGRTDGAANARRLVQAMGRGKDALMALEREFRQDAVDAGVYDQAICSCEFGLVFVPASTDADGSASAHPSVGRCGLCALGHGQPAHLPALDAMTGHPLRAGGVP